MTRAFGTKHPCPRDLSLVTLAHIACSDDEAGSTAADLGPADNGSSDLGSAADDAGSAAEDAGSATDDAGSASGDTLVDLFPSSLFTVSPTTVNCQLDNGSSTQCYQISFNNYQTSTGALCPQTIDDIGGLGIYDGATNPGFQVLKRDLWEVIELYGVALYDGMPLTGHPPMASMPVTGSSTSPWSSRTGSITTTRSTRGRRTSRPASWAPPSVTR